MGVLMANHKCKRIIDGKTYNTETATQIAGGDEEHEIGRYSTGNYLYQTRFGAFFEFKFLAGAFEEDNETIVPLTPDDARRWLEEKVSWDPSLIEKLFGEMPEAGSGEIKFTLRLPESLSSKLRARAEENKQSLNAWIVRCLERCANLEGEKS
jgi:HicB family